ncbi:MAG: LacI family DNA-binding transcriptional regulator [Thermogemmatispora sp.]|uniref:LacI family DNA-binding transcriptional regulator n=1 Tax=Thermogemmatispora sp. TaxID=1968838 RepID=UPI00261B328F|nr:LacI family DNA-binding transcriptional regulator [Thermogemmatispora sp.]MBX5457915.1 LacI family DNA-binding transcriptional regulator [Thermogemmatispora sp.]
MKESRFQQQPHERPGAARKGHMVTIYDIARAAGVAKSTVANVLSGKGKVSEATRQRVLYYARELGYRPNLLARNLSQHRTFTVALILPTIANPFYPEIMEAIEHILRQRDYQTLFCNTHGDFALGRQQMERLMSRWVDGYIIMGSSMDIADIAHYFRQGVPIVLCDWQENESPSDIPQVTVDFFRAGQLAAEHLLALGHRRIAVIVDEPQQHLRLEGFRTTLRQAGLELPPDRIALGDSSLESGYAAARQLLSVGQELAPPTAIFATNDWMALGAMELVLDRGLRVPEDISIVGLDDIVVSAHLRPPLTTIAIPKTRLAQEATELLLAQIEAASQEQGRELPPAGEGTDGAAQRQGVTAPLRLVPPSLVVRQSTAVPASP